MAKYHMRRSEKAIESAEEVRAVLDAGEYVSIAMCSGGEPYIVTMNYGYDEARNALYFHCAKAGMKLEFVRQNPVVCATLLEDLGYKKGECDHRYRSLIIRGRMMVVEELDEKEHAMDVLLDHLEDDPGPIRERSLDSDERYRGVGVLRLDIETITGKRGL